MKTLEQFMLEKVLVLDGAMGTQIFERKPTVDDYGGADLEGCVEILNETRREWIQNIHASYFDAGADVVETNTFGCNRIVLDEFGIGQRAFDLNLKAAHLAKEVANSYNTPKFVVGSIGPGTKLLTLLQVDYTSLYESYFIQMQGLLKGGADALLIETSQDIGQIKCAVRAAKHAMAQVGVRRPIWVQMTIETTGTMLVGTDVVAALTVIESLGIDVVGLNCATGPDEMRQHIAYLSEASPFPVSCLPNAGLPMNVGGQTVYPLGPSDFAAKVTHMAKDFSLAIVGGCCGTSPDHIRALAASAGGLSPKTPKGKYERSVSSLYNAVPLSLEPRPLYVGERTNANGSKKFRDLLAIEDWEGLVAIAKGQLKEGAHVLDVCVAYVGRNEPRDMEEFLKRTVTQVNIPIMIDSTESNVIEKALQIAPGKCVVNSFNFEDGEGKARKVLELCREYGAAVVALTIDETGMAKSLDHKKQVVDRIVALACGEYGIHPNDLIIDPLTFTLGSGDEEFRASATATLEGIRYIKERHPGVQTILGLSNVSFGLSPFPRQILNSLMLYHAVKFGLDMAILNASKILPLSRIDVDDARIAEDLLFDRRTAQYDPLKAFLARFDGGRKNEATSADARAALTVDERLKLDIIDGEKALIAADALEAMKTRTPLSIINDVLLDGMRIVGERFGAGEMQLPFVLESAEAMKLAVKTLEPFMEKKDGYSKGRMLLATVKGDVHDIGKNLVEIILSNNGYEVVNLGIKQPIEAILEKYKALGPEKIDCIGLSGLLVKSTVIMKENLEYMATLGYTVPVVLGGAALTRAFVEETCQAVYPGPVLYAGDAFDGLHYMERMAAAKERGDKVDVKILRGKGNTAKIITQEDVSTRAEITSGCNLVEEDGLRSRIKIVRKGDSQTPLDANGQSTWVRRNEPIPAPPFFGTRVLDIPMEEAFGFLDKFALVRSRWGFQQGNMTDDAFARVLSEKAAPTLEKWRTRLLSENILSPQAIYGYFPVCSEGNTVLVYAPQTQASTKPEKREIIARFSFPRQPSGRRLCISDFYAPVSSGFLDVLGVQLVTMGEQASEVTAHLYAKQDFSDYFFFHGLATELTEACAERIHKRIRTECGTAGRDAASIRQLFSQGYQGSRYSFGYPACPEMELNGPLLELLDSGRIGVHLSESFQMVPEQSTSALVALHPQARYFAT